MKAQHEALKKQGRARQRKGRGKKRSRTRPGRPTSARACTGKKLPSPSGPRPYRTRAGRRGRRSPTKMNALPRRSS